MPKFDTKEAVYKYLAALEAEMGVSPVIGDRALCEATGTLYEEVVLDRDRPGEVWGLPDDPPYNRRAERFGTPEEAWNAWVDGFERWLEDREGKIHWRIKPELCEATEEDGSPLKEPFAIYARLTVG